MKSTQLKKDDIEFLEISDFKSIGPTHRVTFGALTVHAGANRTGKSTLMQPVLLLKQTLDSSFDEGPLRLDGPNVNVRSASRLISKVPGARTDGFEFCFGLEGGGRFRLGFSYEDGRGLDVELMEGPLPWGAVHTLRKNMTPEELLATLPLGTTTLGANFEVAVPARDRCFLDTDIRWPIDDLARKARLSQLADCTFPIGNLPANSCTYRQSEERPRVSIRLLESPACTVARLTSYPRAS
jgi:hypothetical protein